MNTYPTSNVVPFYQPQPQQPAGGLGFIQQAQAPGFDWKWIIIAALVAYIAYTTFTGQEAQSPRERRVRAVRKRLDSRTWAA